ncbi:MAG: DUF3397 family protein [Aerococcus sp.]|nr:DUF3397 family protein [Aerococcus sp.]
MPFRWMEIILYLLPVAMLGIALQLRPMLNRIPRWHLAPVDIVHPTLWMCIHVLSVRFFYFSLFPVVLMLIGVLGLWRVIYYYRHGIVRFSGNKLFRSISNPLFMLEFIGNYALVIYRLYSLFFA